MQWSQGFRRLHCLLSQVNFEDVGFQTRLLLATGALSTSSD
jgi:hypothetical protein